MVKTNKRKHNTYRTVESPWAGKSHPVRRPRPTPPPPPPPPPTRVRGTRAATGARLTRTHLFPRRTHLSRRGGGYVRTRRNNFISSPAPIAELTTATAAAAVCYYFNCYIITRPPHAPSRRLFPTGTPTITIIIITVRGRPYAGVGYYTLCIANRDRIIIIIVLATVADASSRACVTRRRIKRSVAWTRLRGAIKSSPVTAGVCVRREM